MKSHSDGAEQMVFDALKNLDIGAIVVSNVDMKEFRRKAEAIHEQYKILVENYNKLMNTHSVGKSMPKNFHFV